MVTAKRVLALIALLVAAGTDATSQSTPPVAARYERVDHFWWLDRDRAAVERRFRDTLGFTLGPDVEYPHADLRHIWFADGSFIEFVAQRPQQPALGEAVTAFLEKHEGAWKMGIHVNDLEAVSRDLAGRGLKVSGTEGGTWQGLGGRKDLPVEMWQGVDLLSAPGHLAYFWRFTPGWDLMRAHLPDLDPLRTESTTHANTAVGLRTPWLATWDLERTRREFAFAGAAGATFEIPHLAAVGQWLDLARGRLLLLQATSRASPVMQHLFVRGEGVMGATVEVRDLEHARRFIETRSMERLTPYQGVEGRSVLLPARLTHGVAIELFQR